MMCLFCGNRVKCWEDMPDEELSLQFVKCGYDDYCLAEEIDVEDLLSESQRRVDEQNSIENAG